MPRETAAAHNVVVAIVTATSQEEWERLCSRAFVPLRISTGEDRFVATMDHRAVGSASFTRIQSTVRGHGGEVVRTADLVDEDDVDTALFSLQLGGSNTVEQAGRLAVIDPSQGALYLADEPYRLGIPVTTDSLILKAPTGALGLDRQALSRLSARTLSVRSSPSLALLRRVMGSHLTDRPLVAAASEAARVSVELLGSALRSAAGAPVPARSREAVRAALRARIARGLADPGLDVPSLAEAEHVSPRTVHAVFAEVHSSPAHEIHMMRMQRATRLLRETNLPVADIAVGCGFGEPTSFTRAFRRTFDMTPRAYRDGSRSDPADPG